MKDKVARFASIIGHPVVLMPAAALWLASSRDSSGTLLGSLSSVLIAVAAAALVFSVWSVRTGRWEHVDASNRSERRSLNWFLAPLLLAAAAVTWRSYPTHAPAIGFLVSGLAVVAALALSPLLKISLHTCFAAIATGLLWPNLQLIGAGVLVVAALAWSRVVLRRHTLAEVLLGALIGAASALGYHALVG